MLAQSPQLHSLELKCISSTQDGRTLEGLLLPQLHDISLAGLVLSEPFHLLQSHQNIQTAHLQSTFVTTPPSSTNSLLPQLTTCEADHQGALWIVQPLPDGTARPLTTLKILGSLSATQHFNGLDFRPVGASLRYLSIPLLFSSQQKKCWKKVLQELGSMCPALHRLRIGHLEKVKPRVKRLEETAFVSET